MNPLPGERICTCACHVDGTNIMHIYPCCQLCYDKYIPEMSVDRVLRQPIPMSMVDLRRYDALACGGFREGDIVEVQGDAKFTKGTYRAMFHHASKGGLHVVRPLGSGELTSVPPKCVRFVSRSKILPEENPTGGPEAR